MHISYRNCRPLFKQCKSKTTFKHLAAKELKIKNSFIFVTMAAYRYSHSLLSKSSGDRGGTRRKQPDITGKSRNLLVDAALVLVQQELSKTEGANIDEMINGSVPYGLALFMTCHLCVISGSVQTFRSVFIWIYRFIIKVQKE